MSITTAQFDIAKVRAEFPILSQEVNGKPLAYLDNAATAQKPAAVLNAMRNYYERYNANIHRGVHTLSQLATEAYEAGREKVRAFVNAAHAHEIVYTSGTTDGINLVAATWGRANIQKGDEILLSRLEHHSNIVPWQMLAAEKGAIIKVIEINHKGEILLESLDALLNERTKLVAVNHVSNALGTINPVAEIIRKAHAVGALVMIDGAQSAPHMAIDVQDLDADFYTFSAHKVVGPTGVGILYGKEAILEAMPPYRGGGEMIKTVSFEKTTYNTLPHKFEAGTPHIEGGISFGAAIDYMMDLGMESIAAHEHDLLVYGTEKLQAIEGIKFYGQAAQKASVISFLIDGLHPYDVGAIVDKLGVAVRTGHHCCQPLMDWYGIPGTIRASFAFYNNFEDIDRLVAAVDRAAGMLR